MEMAASDPSGPSTLAAPAGTALRGGEAPGSKRDRKRQLLMERLSALTEKFERDRDFTYRDQLQKVQIDITLVQRIDPYAENIVDTVNDALQEYTNSQGQSASPDNVRSLLDMAGPRFQEWAQSISDLHELRDFHLTQQHREFDRKRQEYENTHQYKVETAKREHQALTSTLRDRLINVLTHKKNRLNKEKEALEVSDSSALLLHPNQFSIANPASPGGAHGKRATRLRKDAEDHGGSDSKKRKRNGEDDGSPGPMRRALDTSNTTPIWQSEKLRAAARQNGPVYSMDKLFTDKELALTYNQAAISAHKHILRHRAYGGADAAGNGTDVNGAHENGEREESPPSAPAMERQVSHQTRSTRGVNANYSDEKNFGADGIANFEIPANLDLLNPQDAPKMPPAMPQQYLKPNLRQSDQNFPTSLSQDDINSDLHVMNVFKNYDKSVRTGASLTIPNGLRKILEVAAVPLNQNKYLDFAGTARRDPDKIREEMGLPPAGSWQEPVHERTPHGPSSLATPTAAIPMSRQSSLGGVSMTRQGTGGSGRGKGRKN